MQDLKVGDKCTFRLKDIEPEEFKQACPGIAYYDEKPCTITCEALDSYYDIEFEDGVDVYAVSDYHLDKCELK